MLWLEKRMEELDLRVEDVANYVGVSESAVKSWLYTRKKTFAPDGEEEMARWLKLLEILEWTWLDVLEAVGYEIPVSYPPHQLNLLYRLNKLPASQQAHCLRMLQAVLTVCETENLDDLL